MRQHSIRPEYVEFIPKSLQEGVLYISRRFKTASHLCCCGCGTRIVTPLREAEYVLDETATGVTLSPSVGNWDHPCQSHYLIQNNRVVWARAMSRAEIERGRAHDQAFRNAYFKRVTWPWWRRAASWFKRLISG